MNNKLARKIIKDEVVVAEPQFFDKFTVVQATVQTANHLFSATGISRCSTKDKYSKEAGINKARGQALEALKRKLTGKEVHDSHQSTTVRQIGIDFGIEENFKVGDKVQVANWEEAKKSKFYIKEKDSVCSLRSTYFDEKIKEVIRVSDIYYNGVKTASCELDDFIDLPFSLLRKYND